MARKVSKTRRSETQENQSDTYLDKVNTQVESNQSRLTMILGGLIILVVVILLFNYFNRSQPSIGPSQQAEQQEDEGDVTPENLPGKYTVKEGDTLFTIAENYYKDGYKYTEIATANNMTDPNSLEVGQEIEIPKIDMAVAGESSLQPEEAVAAPEATPTEEAMVASPSPVAESTPSPAPESQGGQADGTSMTTDWGTPITVDTYTVVEGDWLSTIAARAYNGDVLSYTKIAQANNIQNPDLIVPGQVLSLPR